VVLSKMVLNTNVLLAWVIVAIGLLGFIVAHTIEKWYKALLPGLLALATVAFGLYCVIRVTNKGASEPPPETIESTVDEAGVQPPDVFEMRLPEGPADLKAQLTTEILPPFYMREEKKLKVTVAIKNRGPKPVASVKVAVWLGTKANPKAGHRRGRDFAFDKPLQAGEEGHVPITFPDIESLDIFRDPIAHIYEAH